MDGCARACYSQMRELTATVNKCMETILVLRHAFLLLHVFCRDEGPSGPEARAASEYEARVNPFSEFQRSEIEQRVRSSGVFVWEKGLGPLNL